MITAALTRAAPVPEPDAYAVAAHEVLNKVGVAWLHSRRLSRELGPAGHPSSATADLISRQLGAAVAALEGLVRGLPWPVEDGPR